MNRPRRDLLTDQPYRTSTRVVVGVGWTASAPVPDVHVSCMAMGAKGKKHGAVHPDWMESWFGGSLSWTATDLRGDRSSGDVEQVDLELQAIPSFVDVMVVGISATHGRLDRLLDLHLRLFEAGSKGSELARMDLAGPLRGEGLLLAAVVRVGSLWAVTGLTEPAKIARGKGLAKSASSWWKGEEKRIRAKLG